jgi:hypothetical protein
MLSSEPAILVPREHASKLQYADDAVEAREVVRRRHVSTAISVLRDYTQKAHVPLTRALFYYVFNTRANNSCAVLMVVK